MIEFDCYECGRFFKVADNHAGKTGKCPDCKIELTVPSLDLEIKRNYNHANCEGDLSFELGHLYRSLIKHKYDLNLCNTETNIRHNVLFATFSTSNDRTHTITIIQPEKGGLINCTTEIGETDRLTKNQIIQILKEFDCGDGMIFNAGVSEDNKITARFCFRSPPSDPLEFCVIVERLANFADTIEEEFFGIDAN